MKRWYVVHTYSGYENKVKAFLEHKVKTSGLSDKISRIIVPSEQVVVVENGMKKTVNRKFFPGYVLIEMELTDQTWDVVRKTPGVTSFVGPKYRPVPLSDEDVERILKHMEEVEKPRSEVRFGKGNVVRVISGPFADFEGVVDDVDLDRGKVRVMVTIFGRSTPLELDFTQVERS
jgi:transcriptional antiterminator NusG